MVYTPKSKRHASLHGHIQEVEEIRVEEISKKPYNRVHATLIVADGLTMKDVRQFLNSKPTKFYLDALSVFHSLRGEE